MSERIRAVKKHLEFSIRWKGDRTGILEMRRHYTNYFKGIPDFKPFRMKLVDLLEQEEIYNVLDEITEVYSNQEVQIPA
jgi:tRNA-dihydrouridine synthase